MSREILDAIKKETGLDGEFIRHTGTGHTIYRFGPVRYTVPGTPSDRRAVQNCVSDVKRELRKLTKVGTVGEQVVQKQSRTKKEKRKDANGLNAAQIARNQIETLERRIQALERYNSLLMRTNEALEGELKALVETRNIEKEIHKLRLAALQSRSLWEILRDWWKQKACR